MSDAMNETIISLSRRILGFLLALIWLVGCAEGEEVASFTPPAPTLRPTPTLVAQSPPPLPGQTLPPTPLVTTTAAAAATATTPATPTITVTPSPTLSPTATPLPAVWLARAQTALSHQDYAAARDAFQASLAANALPAADAQTARYGLAQAYLGLEMWAEAGDVLATYLDETHDAAPQMPATTVTLTATLTVTPTVAASSQAHPQAASFLLAVALESQGDCGAAIAAYETYLAANRGMAAYVQPRIAACRLLLADRAGALTAYEAAAAAPAHRLTRVALHQTLAAAYMEDSNYAQAIAHYDAIAEIAVTEYTLGQVTFLAGAAELQAGNTAAAYERFLTAVNNYPRSYDSYQALVALVQAEQPVDQFQRGLVDYYAAAYLPAIDAFQNYLTANPQEYRADTHLYLAWCYEGVGNLAAALAQLGEYGRLEPAAAQIETAKLYARSGQWANAIAAYEDYVAAYPDGPDAAFAAWWAAVLAERQDDPLRASALYRQMASAYSWHPDAAEALFRAGWLAWQAGDQEAAYSAWQSSIAQYPNQEYGAASLLWLLKQLPADSPALNDLRAQAQIWPGVGYYALRLRQTVAAAPPFPPSRPLSLPAESTPNDEEQRIAAAAWLAGWWGTSDNLARLPAAIAQDERLQRGLRLWQLGLYAEASRELDWLRQDYAANALASYQLALWFRDQGIYRLSIIAAATVQSLSGQTIFDLPVHLARLIYPVYYADLILPLAAEYGYDPLLQFSLVRQESLFESFATSSAVAQGLSQVIPDTGAYIAQRLDWLDYNNADLYKPHVGLRFGAFYLAEQLNAFDGHIYAALAAYNAGPGNAARWHALAPTDPDTFVEVINFAETRLYVERIFLGYHIYHHLYSR